jgi:hypothetical protein
VSLHWLWGPNFFPIYPMKVSLPSQLFGVSAQGDYKSGEMIMTCSKARNVLGKDWRFQADTGRRRVFP